MREAKPTLAARHLRAECPDNSSIGQTRSVIPSTVAGDVGESNRRRRSSRRKLGQGKQGESSDVGLGLRRLAKLSAWARVCGKRAKGGAHKSDSDGPLAASP